MGARLVAGLGARAACAVLSVSLSRQCFGVLGLVRATGLFPACPGHHPILSHRGLAGLPGRVDSLFYCWRWVWIS